MEREHNTRVSDGRMIKREISVGDIVSLLVAISTIFVAYGKLDTRVTAVETVQSVRIKVSETFQQDIKMTLRDITEKVNSIAERMPRK